MGVRLSISYSYRVSITTTAYQLRPAGAPALYAHWKGAEMVCSLFISQIIIQASLIPDSAYPVNVEGSPGENSFAAGGLGCGGQAMLGLSRIWKEDRARGLSDAWGKWRMSYLLTVSALSTNSCRGAVAAGTCRLKCGSFFRGPITALKGR